MGKSTINGSFHSFLYVYQRVNQEVSVAFFGSHCLVTTRKVPKAGSWWTTAPSVPKRSSVPLRGGKICCSYGVNHGDLHSQTLYIYGLIWVNQLTMFHHRKSDLWASMVRSAYRGYIDLY